MRTAGGLSLLSLTWAEVQVVVLHTSSVDFTSAALAQPGTCRPRWADSCRPADDRLRRCPAALPRNGQGGRDDVVAAAGDTRGGYLWHYLTYHLQAAGLGSELDELCCDLRFLAVRLRSSGPRPLAPTWPVPPPRRRAAAARDRADAHLLAPLEAARGCDHHLDQQARRVSPTSPASCPSCGGTCMPGQPGRPGRRRTFDELIATSRAAPGG